MSDAIRYWDLRDLCAKKTPVTPPYCWLLLKQWEAIPPDQWHCYFCVAISPIESASEYIQSDQALHLEKAAIYVEKLLAGKSAAHLPARITSYYSDNKATMIDPYELEAQYFGDQFATPYPARGLGAFLNKNSAPWQLHAKTERELRNLLAWLRL